MSDSQSIIERAREACDYGRYNQALLLLNALIEQTPTAAAWLERGRVYAALNNSEHARADWESASRADPHGAIGDTARRELLRSLTPRPQSHPAEPVLHRKRPHRWITTLVVLLLVLSLLCSIVTVVDVGRNVLRSVPTATPTHSSP